MEREPESEAVRRSLKTRRKSVSVLCFVPKIVLIKMTRKPIKNNFLNKFGHKGQISNRPKFVFSTFGSREVFFRVVRSFDYGCFHTGRKNAGGQGLVYNGSEQTNNLVRTLKQ